VPSQLGDLSTIVKKNFFLKNILGICLGQQAIAETFGTELKNTICVLHGKYSYSITTDEKTFNLIPNKIKVGRYHSWIVSKYKINKILKITALSLKGDIMAIRNKYYDVYGLQIHPESILTIYGENIIYNWLNIH
jgi:anthranilate synthase component II